ncbi:DUF2970 domain-containing protein [Ideonella azotifigens]|uniref:DUF2970 domain-containing protein n=1 Tax=Ideonella azotifigens TaxID=513160 RepID=A0ABN1KI70_9BURK|nr:DUF2970 domain-containing protein [Ideonella azotifigens]MCD2339600.1 DUF2970 domain-containing protein [Ideonella azotifigens]
MTDKPAAEPSLLARKGSFLGTLKAVAWSFFGVRRGTDYERDLGQLNPLHLVVAAVIGAALFVLALVLLANWVVGSGAAASA